MEGTQWTFFVATNIDELVSIGIVDPGEIRIKRIYVLLITG